MRKLISAAVCAALAVLLVIPVAAHCHYRARQQAVPRYAVCTVEGCREAGRHVHNGVTCCGYDHEGGWCVGTECTACQSAAVCNPAPAVSSTPVYSGHHGHHGHHGC